MVNKVILVCNLGHYFLLADTRRRKAVADVLRSVAALVDPPAVSRR